MRGGIPLRTHGFAVADVLRPAIWAVCLRVPEPRLIADSGARFPKSWDTGYIVNDMHTSFANGMSTKLVGLPSATPGNFWAGGGKCQRLRATGKPDDISPARVYVSKLGYSLFSGNTVFSSRSDSDEKGGKGWGEEQVRIEKRRG